MISNTKIKNKQLLVDDSLLLPELRSSLDCLTDDECQKMMTECMNLGYKVQMMSRMEVTGIDKPIGEICNTINQEMLGSRKNMDRHLDIIRDSVIKSTDNIASRISADVDKHLYKMEASNKPLIEHLFNLSSQVEKLTGTVLVSSKKGKMGETILLEILKMYFPLAEVKDMAQKNNQSDIHFTFPDGKPIWIEVKTYSDTVPSKEVGKFKKEMFDNKINYGIFVSRTGIAKCPKINIERLSYGGSIFYIPNVDTESKLVVFALMWIQYMENHESSKKSSEGSCMEESEKLKMEKIFNLIKGEIEQLSEMSKQHVLMKKRVDKSYKSLKREVERSMEDIMLNLTNLETEFDKSVAKLSGILSVI